METKFKRAKLNNVNESFKNMTSTVNLLPFSLFPWSTVPLKNKNSDWKKLYTFSLLRILCSPSLVNIHILDKF